MKSMKQIRKAVERMKAHWSDIYKESEEDWAFYNLDQWTLDQKQERSGRPMITDDFIRPYVKQVVANVFMNPSAIKLNARDDRGMIKAQALSEALRYIEDVSDSGKAKANAVKCAAVGGFGFLKATYDIETSDAEGLPTIRYEDVKDPFSVMIDEKSIETDGSDMRYFVEFKNDSEYTYYCIEEGRVRWYEVKDDKIVDDEEFPTAKLPLVPVYGEMEYIKGKRTCFGLVRALKDIQHEHNYVKSDAMERLVYTPIVSTVVEEGSMTATEESKLRNSPSSPQTVIKYKGQDSQDDEAKPYNPPQQLVVQPDVGYASGMLASIQNSAITSTGITSSADQMNATGPESGVAIGKTNANNDRGQLVYDSNMKSSDKRMGYILLEMISNIIAPFGQLPIQNERGENNVITVGMPEIDIATGRPTAPFIPDADIGDASISISSQPAYSTRKEEGLTKMMEMFPALPEEYQTRLWPILVEDMGFPNADAYAKAMTGEAEQGEMDPQQVQMQMQQMQQQMQQAQQQMEQMRQENLQLQVELKTQSQTALAKSQMDNETKIRLKEMDIRANSISDDKEIYTKEVIHGRDIDQKNLAELNKKAMNDDKIAADATKQNKTIMTDAMKEVEQNVDVLM